MLTKLNREATSRPLQHPVKVLQFGEGNFLRAFADWMIDIMNERAGFNGSVQVVQPIRAGMAKLVNEQDGLYHVVLNGILGGKPVRDIRLITSVAGALDPHEDFNAFLSTAENPDLRIVISNTTEAGIAFDARDTNANILANSFPGKLAQLLFHRYTFFKGAPDKALVIMPCELIDKNGETLRNLILQYADDWGLGTGFRKWIVHDTIFCNTLVDRIVPGFPKDTIGDLCRETGYEDKLMVTAEAFHLWVIEPCSVAAKDMARVKEIFPAEAAGLQVKFVTDLAPYRTRKVRILNGAHTCMVPVAYLRGLRTVREAVEDPVVGAFIRKTIEEEIIPTLDLPLGELRQFAGDVVERFQNPFIRHELMSIALNSVSKFQVRVLPSILEYHKRTGKLPENLVYSLAALIRFYKGEWKGEVIPLNDTPVVMQFFKDAWVSGDEGVVVKKVLSNSELWGKDLTSIKGLEGLTVWRLSKIGE